jgi:hypothetical protein
LCLLSNLKRGIGNAGFLGSQNQNSSQVVCHFHNARLSVSNFYTRSVRSNGRDL